MQSLLPFLKLTARHPGICGQDAVRAAYGISLPGENAAPVPDDEGKKKERLKKNKSVCYTICKPRWETEGLKTPCTSAVIEGKLEAVKDKSVYGLGSKKLENMTLYKLAIAEMGARKCNRKPCELFAGKSGAAIKAMVKKKA